MTKSIKMAGRKRQFNAAWLFKAVCLFAAACLLSAACLFGHAAIKKFSASNNPTVAAAKQTSPTRAIEEFEVGDNVITDVGQVREKAVGDPNLLAEWERVGAEIDPATTRKVVLEANGAHGDVFRSRLLCSLDWIEAAGAEVGKTIDFSLPEQGFEGQATVLAIEPCPPIKRGRGRTVTGIFVHAGARVIDLYIEGVTEPVGVTDGDPLFCVNADDFVLAGNLKPGDQLRKLDGNVATIAKIELLGDEHRVYNLEVQGEHVYRVTADGLLVHNNSFTPDQQALISLVKEAKLASRTKPLPPGQVQILKEFAQEVGLNFRGPEVHPNRPIGQLPHIHVGPIDHIFVQ